MHTRTHARSHAWQVWRREYAATSIQRVQRGRAARKQVQPIVDDVRNNRAALSVQRVARGFGGRRAAVHKIERAKQAMLDDMAVALQRIAYGFLARCAARRLDIRKANALKRVHALVLQRVCRGMVGRAAWRGEIKLAAMRSDTEIRLQQRTQEAATTMQVLPNVA